MSKQKATAEPFQEGFISKAGKRTHVFTDYRWNDGTVMRRWWVDPSRVELASVALRPYSLKKPDPTDQ